MTQDELNFIDTYKKELKSYSPEKMAEIYNAFKAGDDSVIAELTEALMPRTLEIAMERAQEHLHIADLIQEGNLGLFMALASFDAKPQEQPFDEYIEDAIVSAIEAYIEENGTIDDTGARVAARLNEIVEAMEDLEKEYGEGAFTLDDVAEQTHMSVNEISELFKLAGEDLGKNDEETGENQ